MYPKKESSKNRRVEDGQGLTEYALILMLAGLAAFAIISILNPSIRDTFSRLVRQAPVAPPSLLAYTPPPTPTPTAGPGTATLTPTPSATPTETSTPTATNTGEPTATATATATRDLGFREYRYVRVIADSEVNGNAFASIAEINLRDGYGNYIERADWSVHYVSSQETDREDGRASNTFDGNDNTIWHTEWYNNLPEHPHDLQIDMGALYNLSYFQYLPRQNSANGRLADYRFCASVDGTSWELLASGTFSNSSSQQANSFTAPKELDTLPDCPLSIEPTATPTQTPTNTATPVPPTATATNTVEPTSTPENELSCELALGKTAISSGNENGTHLPSKAVDGDFGTRWASNYDDNAWLYIDLGARYDVTRVILHWEAAYGRDYRIQVSDNSSNWTTVKEITNGNGGTDDMQNLNGTGRFVRMQGIDRATRWGYSLWEVEICGTPNNQITIIDADFNSNTDGFTYYDDVFGTNNSNKADGKHGSYGNNSTKGAACSFSQKYNLINPYVWWVGQRHLH